ncbi:MAG: hypothetical protein M3081_02565 [Gemmatimonadota bacterium]|nr:hypothetical protein [Gemmatimonadota bacterium]
MMANLRTPAAVAFVAAIAPAELSAELASSNSAKTFASDGAVYPTADSPAARVDVLSGVARTLSLALESAPRERQAKEINNNMTEHFGIDG